jgi:hypothetical protein
MSFTGGSLSAVRDVPPYFVSRQIQLSGSRSTGRDERRSSAGKQTLAPPCASQTRWQELVSNYLSLGCRGLPILPGLPVAAVRLAARQARMEWPVVRLKNLRKEFGFVKPQKSEIAFS